MLQYTQTNGNTEQNSIEVSTGHWYSRGTIMGCSLFFFFNKFIYLFIFGSVGSSLLRAGFL